MDTTETRQDIVGDEFLAPIGRLLGFKLVGSGAGQATIELEAGEQHANPMGTLHGGVLCDIADAAMGVAYSSTLKDGESFTTLELQDQFPAAGLEGKAPRTGQNGQGRQDGRPG